MKHLFLLSLAPLAVACSSSSSSSSAGSDGVNDVAQACAIRSSWKNLQASSCNTCLSEAKVPRCACSDKDWAGKCSTQESAMDAEPTCQGVSTCRAACQPNDCACIDACYAGKDACRTRAAAVDGCTADACDATCR